MLSFLTAVQALFGFSVTSKFGKDSVNVDSDTWQKYIRNPADRIVYPAKIISNHSGGNVTNAQGLLKHGGPPTVFNRTADRHDVPANSPVNALDSSIPTVVLDFGQNIVGNPTISFSGAWSNDSGIRLAFSETLQFLAEHSDFSRSYNGDNITPGTEQIVVPQSHFVWNVTHGCLHGNKVCSDGLHGFRYMKITLDALESDSPITKPYGEVSIDSVYVNISAFMGTPDTFTGWFRCSDKELTQFWFDAIYTNDMCIDEFRVNDTEPRNAASTSLIGKLVLHDGAKRDRDPYVGDLGVSARTLYLSHNATEAVRNVLADLADHQRSDGWIPPASINDYTLPLFDYPLWYIICSYDLVLYTDDKKYAQKYLPHIRRVLDNFYPSVTNQSSGLLSKGINDTGGYGDYAFLPRQGHVTYYNALYVIALKAAANILDYLSEDVVQSHIYRERAATVTRAMNSFLWSPDTGSFLDTSNGPPAYPQDGNSLSILASVAPASSLAAEAILSHLNHSSLFYGNPFYTSPLPDALPSDFRTRVYPFISHFEILARFMSNSPTTALDQIRRTWRWMSTHDPFSTFWEGIGENGSMYEGGYTSAAHGWSTGVASELTEWILGVQPRAPGYSKWRLRPSGVDDIEWAEGKVPTPRGPILASWSYNKESKTFDVKIDSPKTTTGEICIPMSGLHSAAATFSQKPEEDSSDSFRTSWKHQQQHPFKPPPHLWHSSTDTGRVYLNSKLIWINGLRLPIRETDTAVQQSGTIESGGCGVGYLAVSVRGGLRHHVAVKI